MSYIQDLGAFRDASVRSFRDAGRMSFRDAAPMGGMWDTLKEIAKANEPDPFWKQSGAFGGKPPPAPKPWTEQRSAASMASGKKKTGTEKVREFFQGIFGTKPTAPVPPTGPMPVAKPTPSWLLPVGIGAGVLVVVLLAKKEK